MRLACVRISTIRVSFVRAGSVGQWNCRRLADRDRFATILLGLRQDEVLRDRRLAWHLEHEGVITGVDRERTSVELVREWLPVHSHFDVDQISPSATFCRENNGRLYAVDLVDALRAVVAHDGGAHSVGTDLKLFTRCGKLTFGAQRLRLRIGIDALLFGRVVGEGKAGREQRDETNGKDGVRSHEQVESHRHSGLKTLRPLASKKNGGSQLGFAAGFVVVVAAEPGAVAADDAEGAAWPPCVACEPCEVASAAFGVDPAIAKGAAEADGAALATALAKGNALVAMSGMLGRTVDVALGVPDVAAMEEGLSAEAAA